MSPCKHLVLEDTTIVSAPSWTLTGSVYLRIRCTPFHGSKAPFTGSVQATVNLRVKPKWLLKKFLIIAEGSPFSRSKQMCDHWCHFQQKRGLLDGGGQSLFNPCEQLITKDLFIYGLTHMANRDLTWKICLSAKKEKLSPAAVLQTQLESRLQPCWNVFSLWKRSMRVANTRLSAQMIIPANKTVKPLELSGASNAALKTWLFKHEKGRESEQSWSQFGILKFAYLSPQPIICTFGLKKTISSPATAHTQKASLLLGPCYCLQWAKRSWGKPAGIVGSSSR